MAYRGGQATPTKITIGIVGVLVLVFAVIIPGFAYITSFTKADGGHVIVVRNGGPFDNNSIRQIIEPNSGLVSAGLFSSEHPYPSTQRNFKVSGSQNADSNEVINVPTKDGVLVGVEGTFYFDVNYTDEKVLRTFDDRYGTRTYPVPGGAQLAAWDGEQGWNSFLSFTLGNLVQNVLRQEIGNVECADLVASCSLAKNSSAQAAGATPNPTGAGNQTINKVQQAVNDGFTADVDNVLGVPVLIHPRFVLSKVDLPPNVQSDQPGAGRVRGRHGITGCPAARRDRRAHQPAAADRVHRLPRLRCHRRAARTATEHHHVRAGHRVRDHRQVKGSGTCAWSRSASCCCSCSWSGWHSWRIGHVHSARGQQQKPVRTGRAASTARTGSFTSWCGG